ncbi:hypothetical protein Tco_0805520 [Tanacetum coccineum]
MLSLFPGRLRQISPKLICFRPRMVSKPNSGPPGFPNPFRILMLIVVNNFNRGNNSINKQRETYFNQASIPASGTLLDTMPPAINGSTEDVQPLVVQIQSRNPNTEPNVSPVVTPVVTPVPKASIPFPSRRNDERRKEKANRPKRRILSVILNKLPKKLGDPGTISIPCEFTGITTCNALADLVRALISCPLFRWKVLALPETKPPLACVRA